MAVDVSHLREKHYSYPFAKMIYSRPAPGMLLAHTGKPWRVVSVEDLSPGNWSDERDRPVWEKDGYSDPEAWPRRPYTVTVLPAGTDPADKDAQRYGMTVHADRVWYQRWAVIPEHYAVCVSCGELAPCDELMGEAAGQRAMAVAEKAMAVMDGACPACNEVITHRQKTYDFPGPNVLNPLARDGVRFHQRAKCRPGAAEYEEKWVRADPARERSLLTLRCSGRLAVHEDGTAECRGRNDGTDCPHVYARHAAMTACWSMTHGCPRGCTSRSHGCRPRKGLTKDGDIPMGGAR